MAKSGVEEYTLLIKAETDLAYSLAETEEDDGEWFPKSQIEVIETKGSLLTVYIPDWLAEQNKLI